MKIKKINNWKHKPKFLKIKLIKNQTYKFKESHKHLKIEDIEYRLKKALHLIYKFHIKNKRILFIGTPEDSHRQLMKLFVKTRHLFVPSNIWINGAITNQYSIFNYFLKIKSSNNKIDKEILFQLKKKSDLIVLLNGQENRNILMEGYVSKIPIIDLNSNLDIINFKPTYKVPGSFNIIKQKNNTSFFYLFLKTILKKKTLSTQQRKETNAFQPKFTNHKLQILTKRIN